jgi:3'-phosphoadenosine 5'-phosphosulfate sulfotransferase (PAPS reductase)/FAD synthetase
VSADRFPGGKPHSSSGLASVDDDAPARDSTLDDAIREYRPSHVFALFSGGHDSLCSTSVAAKHPAFTAAVHINTGVGIEATRQFVRDTCERESWPLIEMHPDAKTYRDLIVEKGMPGGPKAHSTMYYWLKQRQVRRLVREHKQGIHGRVMLVTGIRVAESERRMAAVMAQPVHRIGAQVWVNPILQWTKSDCHDHMEAEGLERNIVVDLIHRSGECLCGALAHHSEMKEIERWFPEEAEVLHGYEEIAFRNGHPENVWGARLPDKISRSQLPLCASCEAQAS